MPAALDVNWEAIKLLAQQIGVREAARRVGLKEEAVMQRSAREGWLRDMPRSQPLPPTVLQRVSGVSDAPKAAINYLKDVLLQTRTNHAKAALAVSEDMAKWTEEQPSAMREKDNAQALLSTAKHAALTGGWSEQTAAPKIQLSATGSTDHVIDVEGRVCEDAQLIEEDPLAGF